jgi:hypothetical protein
MSDKNFDELVKRMDLTIRAYNRPPLGLGFTHSYAVKVEPVKIEESPDTYGCIEYEDRRILIDPKLKEHEFSEAYVGSILAYTSPLAHLYEKTGDAKMLFRSQYLRGLCKYVEIKTMSDLHERNPSLHFKVKKDAGGKVVEGGLESEINPDLVRSNQINSIQGEERRKRNLAFRTVEKLTWRVESVDPKSFKFKPHYIYKAIAIACTKSPENLLSYDFDVNFERIMNEVDRLNIFDLYVLGDLAVKSTDIKDVSVIQKCLDENENLQKSNAQIKYVVENVEEINKLSRSAVPLNVRMLVDNALEGLKKAEKPGTAALTKSDIDTLENMRRVLRQWTKENKSIELVDYTFS